MDQQHINQLAEKIAQMISASSDPDDLRSIRRGIETLSARMDNLEAATKQVHSLQRSQLSHPSQDRFAVAEAIADSIFGAEAKEKTCTFEPNDRPCDHCSMCSSRGF